MNEPIRNQKLEIIGYHEKVVRHTRNPARQYGKPLGAYEADNKVTRDANGKIIGRGSKLFRLLPRG